MVESLFIDSLHACSAAPKEGHPDSIKLYDEFSGHCVKFMSLTFQNISLEVVPLQDRLHHGLSIAQASMCPHRHPTRLDPDLQWQYLPRRSCLFSGEVRG